MQCGQTRQNNFQNQYGNIRNYFDNFAFLSVVCVKNTLNILKNDAGYVVVLDAGHGAPDGGVVGTNTGVLESDLNLKMVKILQNYLENAGVKVVLTRKTNTRCRAAQRVQKRRLQTQKRDNRERKSRRGYQHSHELLQGSAVAARSASVLRREKPVFSAVCGDAHAKNQYGNQQKYGGREYAALSGDFYIINSTSAPAAIVECGFLSNAEDEKLLVGDEYKNEFCYHLFSGVMQYLYTGAR